MRRASIAQSRPILIIGAPRSGTTLLATMLNAHPDIFVANETKLLIDFLPDDTSASTDHVSSQRLAEEAGARGLALAPAADIAGPASAPDSAAEMRRLFMGAAELQGKRRWGEKTAVAYRRLPAIARHFPDACFIGLERDVADVAASYERINPTWGAAGGVLHWLQFRRAVARQGPGFRFLLVRYEDLVLNTELTLRRLCDFVGEPFHAAMLRHHETERARDLSRSPEFAGASNAVYTGAVSPERPTAPRWLIEAARRYARRLEAGAGDVRPPAWYLLLDQFVNARVVARETRRNGLRPTLHKIRNALRRRASV
ncbi:MAG TPA: sulfotransferase [Longimicrobiales bacterium]|nr:sulfotransferase [Longimicrobiales bacterium]